MALSQKEKDKIVEEETLRFEARVQAHQKLGMKGGTCGACGQHSGCRGCRIWAWVFGALVLFGLFRCVAMYHGMGGNEPQRLEAPSSQGLGQEPPKQGVK